MSNLGQGRADQRHAIILIKIDHHKGNYRHAITQNNVDDAIVRNNTVRGGVNVSIEPEINLCDVKNAVIERNISSMILKNKMKPSTWLV